MNITNCDICKKVVKKNEDKARVYLPSFSWHDVCMRCMNKYSELLLKRLNAEQKELRSRVRRSFLVAR